MSGGHYVTIPFVTYKPLGGCFVVVEHIRIRKEFPHLENDGVELPYIEARFLGDNVSPHVVNDRWTPVEVIELRLGESKQQVT